MCTIQTLPWSFNSQPYTFKVTSNWHPVIQLLKIKKKYKKEIYECIYILHTHRERYVHRLTHTHLTQTHTDMHRCGAVDHARKLDKVQWIQKPWLPHIWGQYVFHLLIPNQVPVLEHCDHDTLWRGPLQSVTYGQCRKPLHMQVRHS